jgi:hypothetical protein
MGSLRAGDAAARFENTLVRPRVVVCGVRWSIAMPVEDAETSASSLRADAMSVDGTSRTVWTGSAQVLCLGPRRISNESGIFLSTCGISAPGGRPALRAPPLS